MHGSRPAVAVARAPVVLLLECRPTRKSPPPRRPRNDNFSGPATVLYASVINHYYDYAPFFADEDE
jgi:hypothetical protein